VINTNFEDFHKPKSKISIINGRKYNHFESNFPKNPSSAIFQMGRKKSWKIVGNPKLTPKNL
jgi:hypothetical protein